MDYEIQYFLLSCFTGISRHALLKSKSLLEHVKKTVIRLSNAKWKR